MRLLFFLFLLLLLLPGGKGAFGQVPPTIIKGKVTDAETGEALPFVSVVLKGSNIGTTTDFDGFFTLKALKATDSLVVSYVGYVRRAKKVVKGTTQTLNFQLTPEAETLMEVVVRPGENPAWRIMRQVMAHKDANDKRRLTAYEYETYNKLELDVDNISEKFRQRKVMQKALGVFDSLKVMAGEDGKPILPVFISESISDYYYTKDPKHVKENIRATKVTGVGVQDGSLVSQLIGSTYQEYNFYQNWVSVSGKDFVSPIADSWKGYYEYDLTDSTAYLGGERTYKIEVKPKRKQDLAFTGTIWITEGTFALKQIDVTVGKGANINYIEKIKIQQELAPTEAGPWLPLKTRVLVDIAEISEQWAGMLCKMYTSSKGFVVNQPRPARFYDQAISVEEDHKLYKEDYWQTARHDSLSQTEQNVYAMIDSIRELPVVRTYVEVVNIIVNGYKSVGKVDVGPYLYAFAFNNVEGNRLRLGGRTNIDFSRKVELHGYLAYGTRDGRFKYNLGSRFIFDRKPWSEIGFDRKVDIDQVGLSTDQLIDNTLFLAFTRFGTLRNPYQSRENRLYVMREVVKGVNQTLSIRTREFDPVVGYFPFRYISQTQENDTSFRQRFTVTELSVETRYANNEIFVQNNNQRISLGNEGWPVVTLRYTVGVKGLLGGNFNYHRLALGVDQDLQLGTFGNARYRLSAGRVFGTVPYPLLEVHLGNETPFYTTAAYSLMNFNEFVSDTYAAFRYEHYLEGLLFNRLPLIRRLKWRALATSNVVYGHISDANLSLSPREPFQQWGKVPYVEVGYGIENILKVLRIDFFHRLTYLQNPGARAFGIKGSLQFKL